MLILSEDNLFEIRFANKTSYLVWADTVRFKDDKIIFSSGDSETAHLKDDILYVLQVIWSHNAN